MGFVRFQNSTSPVATSTEEDDSDRSPSPLGPDPTSTHSFTHTHHHIFYTLSFTQPILDPPSSVSSTGLSSPENPDRAIPSQHIHKNLFIIIFTGIGATIALVFLALFTRQAIAYSRLPRQNLALTATAREELAQEMAGYVEMADRRRRSLLTPPPPYERAPPYDFSLRHTNNNTCS